MSQEDNRYVVGVDGGGSKTLAVVLNAQGVVVGRDYRGSSNYHQAGMTVAQAALQAAIQGAVQAAGLELNQITAAVWALAGAGRPDEQQQFRQVAAEILPGVTVTIVTDAVAALVSGTGRRYGIVLIAGTGMIAYGEDRQGKQARAGGWGYLLDQGSGYDLGREALRAVTAAHDKADPTSSLTSQILESLALKQTSELVGWLYHPQRQVAEVARLAPLVLAEAEAGDLAAMGIVTRAARALVEAATQVARRLDFEEAALPLTLAGGLLTENSYYRELVTQFLRTALPQAQARLPQVEAAVGAAWLALETSGVQLEHKAPTAATIPGAWASEQINLLSRELDHYSARQIAGLMHLEDQQAVAAVGPTLPVVAQVVEAIADRMEGGGRLIYVGAGTSGRLGVLDASECPPTFSTRPGQVIGIIAGGPGALIDSVEGAEDDPEAGGAAIRALKVDRVDSVVGIAASGRTPYVQGALAEAQKRGALTVALICNLPAPLAGQADYVIAPLIGPEVITGSTRLKAGTAQKLVLNMLSTATMVRLGKTYGNLMVDVHPSNSKLRARAIRIVAQACGIGEEAAQTALARSGGEVKVAIVSQLAACSAEVARSYLAEAKGVVRAALTLATRKNS